MKRLVLYDESTGETKGYVFLSNDDDVRFYPNSIEIPIDHPGVHDQANWHVQQGRLVKKG